MKTWCPRRNRASGNAHPAEPARARVCLEPGLGQAGRCRRLCRGPGARPYTRPALRGTHAGRSNAKAGCSACCPQAAPAPGWAARAARGSAPGRQRQRRREKRREGALQRAPHAARAPRVLGLAAVAVVALAVGARLDLARVGRHHAALRRALSPGRRRRLARPHAASPAFTTPRRPRPARSRRAACGACTAPLRTQARRPSHADHPVLPGNPVFAPSATACFARRIAVLAGGHQAAFAGRPIRTL